MQEDCHGRLLAPFLFSSLPRLGFQYINFGGTQKIYKIIFSSGLSPGFKLNRVQVITLSALPCLCSAHHWLGGVPSNSVYPLLILSSGLCSILAFHRPILLWQFPSLLQSPPFSLIILSSPPPWKELPHISYSASGRMLYHSCPPWFTFVLV